MASAIVPMGCVDNKGTEDYELEVLLAVSIKAMTRSMGKHTQVSSVYIAVLAEAVREELPVPALPFLLMVGAGAPEGLDCARQTRRQAVGRNEQGLVAMHKRHALQDRFQLQLVECGTRLHP